MVREANIFDIPQINELGKLLHQNFEKLVNIKKMLDDGYSKVIIYEKDDVILGFISATVLYDTCDILDIVVDPNHRREKIASNLLTYLISECGENMKLMTLEVATHNIPALKLYEKFGFEIIYKREHYYKNDDAYLMARKSE